ncbi:MAG: 50S ribosomal protein L35 [Gammaproteobacteria bacterium]|nr:50S ribosomal protein L35 [Pseudomonadota bacterium]MCH9662893.1 50S ribosomal protein L35 [Gammaproteobacteria bacterium]
MPKLKSHRGASKRFRIKSSGAAVRAQSHRRHILTKKSTKRKRHLRSPAQIHDADTASVRRLLSGS